MMLSFSRTPDLLTMMDFENSSQAHSWMFSDETLSQCRQKAVSRPMEESIVGTARVRKFASGFDRLHAAETDDTQCFAPVMTMRSPHENTGLGEIEGTWFTPVVSCSEQESLIRFHAHQLRKLVGPSAVYRGLVRSSSVLATAITLLRRFYLSNSIVDFCPRKMAVASAFLAAKLEDHRVEAAQLQRGILLLDNAFHSIFQQIQLLQTATEMIAHRAQTPSSYKNELKAVSLGEIEEGERHLMEGLNYQLRCHHPHGAIKVLIKDLMVYLSGRCKPTDLPRNHGYEWDPILAFRRQAMLSPRGIWDDTERGDRVLYKKAVCVAHNALVFTDVPFLFPPGQIAFAVVSIASKALQQERGADDHSPLDPDVRDYLRARFPSRQEQELRKFEDEVIKIVHCIDKSPVLKPRPNNVLRPVNSVHMSRREVSKRAVEEAFRVRPPSHQPTYNREPCGSIHNKKRKDDLPFSSTPVTRSNVREKIAKVTFEF